MTYQEQSNCDDLSYGGPFVSVEIDFTREQKDRSRYIIDKFEAVLEAKMRKPVTESHCKSLNCLTHRLI